MRLFDNAAKQLEGDYGCFLDYLERNEVILSSKSMNIGNKDCQKLNQLFQVRERYQSYGRTQQFYGVIDFFYFFSVKSGILQIVKKKGYTMQRSERYGQFFRLSVIERYILMMSVWLGEYEEALGNDYIDFDARNLLTFMKDKEPNSVIKFPYNENTAAIWGGRYHTSIRIAALFHLIEIEWLDEHEEAEENKFRIRALYATSEGCSVEKLMEKQDRIFWYSINMGSVLSVLKCIDEKNVENMEMRLMAFWANPVESGGSTIGFKVQVGSCVRYIQIGDQYTLDDLHYFIQKSVGFDMDHLYYFQIGTGSSKIRYFAPQCEDEPYLADTVSLTELHLSEGMKFEYLFDFGDQWRFSVAVDKILPEHSETCRIRKVKGENPEQYSLWE